jgi:hypothetical protein
MTTADVGSSAGGENDSPQAAPPPSDGLRYDVFLSYSRADLDVAAKMERDLEAFPLPRGVRKLLGHRHLNVFRDISDMTGNQLESGIEQRLEQSHALVVPCFPLRDAPNTSPSNSADSHNSAAPARSFPQ